MGSVNRLLGGDASEDPENASGTEHAVMLHFPLADAMPSPEEFQRYCRLEDELEEVLAAVGVGEFEGNEFGGGEFVIFLYGPDAERLWEAIQPVLEPHPFPKGSYAIKRFGGPDCTNEDRVSLEWDG